MAIVTQDNQPHKDKTWFGVDFDGTLATYPKDGIKDPSYVGDPIWPTIYRTQQRLANGQRVKIFTARVWSDGTDEGNKNVLIARAVISAFCLEHFGQLLEITNTKDPFMSGLEDDKANLVPNTGYPIGWHVQEID
jgi:hypothetical protein